MSGYGFLHQLAADTITEWKTGAVTLTRTVNAPADPATPSTPGAATTTVYTLDAVVRGVSADYVLPNSTIVATDLMVVASPIALLAGARVAMVPQMSDVLTIDGAAKAIKAIKPAPAAGEAAVFRIFVAS